MGTRLSSREQEGTAVDHERLAGHEAARIGTQEQSDRPDVGLGIALAAHRVVAQERTVLGFVAGGRLLPALGRRAGGDGVDDYAVAAPLARGGAGQRADRLLR